MDPIQFVRDQFGGPSFDMGEYQGLKQNVIQLNESVSQIKSELAKITSFLSKDTDSHDASTDGTVICDHHNDSNQSMENNVGDSNHASLLNDSDVLDDTANQTIINVQPNDLSTEEHNKITGDEYTMEIVEVDVVCQTNDSFQSDDTISNSVIYTSQSKITMPNGNGSITFGDFDEPQIEEACNDGVADQSPSTESIGIANGVSHSMNVELVIKDVQINDTDSKSMKCEMASTPKKLSDDTNADGVDSKMDINFEDLPIIMKSDDSEDQP